MFGTMKSFFLFCLLVSFFLSSINGETQQEDNQLNDETEKRPAPPCTDSDVNCSLIGATKWLLWQQDADWGWNGGTSTSSVVLAMQLANESWHQERALKTQLSIKQMEIELLAELARAAKLSGCGNDSQRHTRLAKISVGRLAHYILALEATCHDTRDFFGNDLVEVLERNMKHFPREGFSNHFQYALGVLALCQSGDGAVKVKHIRQLLNGQRDDGCYRFDGQGPDVASLSLMALACSKDSLPRYSVYLQSRFEEKFNKTVSCILNKQQDDGSFGNGISTALASQALNAAGIAPSIWRAEDALQRVLETQHEDGNFGNLGATVQILPLLASRNYGSLRDVKAACLVHGVKPGVKPVDTQTDNVAGVTPVIQGPPITIQIWVQNGVDKERENVTLSVTAPQGSTLFKFLQAAVEQSQGSFRFESRMTDFGNSMTSFNGVRNDAINNWYWSILIGQDRESAQTGVDGIIPMDSVDYIFFYRAY